MDKRLLPYFQNSQREVFNNTPKPMFDEMNFPVGIPEIKRRRRWAVSFSTDWKFFAITPAINLNFHGFTFEIEWLFFAIYIDRNTM